MPGFTGKDEPNFGLVAMAIIVLVVSVILPLARAGDPETPVAEGFETWNPNGWVSASGFPGAIGDLPSAHSGFHGANWNASYSTLYLWKDTTLEADALKNATIIFWLQVNELTVASDWNFEIFAAESYYNGYIGLWGFANNATGNYIWLQSEAPTASGNSSIDTFNTVPVVLLDWYELRIDYICDDVTGLIEFRINGTSYAKFEGDTKKASDDWGIDTQYAWEVGQGFSLAGCSFNFDIDDISITEYTAYVPPSEPVEPFIPYIPIDLFMALVGLALLFGGGFWAIDQFRSHVWIQGFNGLIVSLIGASLLIGWAYV